MEPLYVVGIDSQGISKVETAKPIEGERGYASETFYASEPGITWNPHEHFTQATYGTKVEAQAFRDGAIALRNTILSSIGVNL